MLLLSNMQTHQLLIIILAVYQPSIWGQTIKEFSVENDDTKPVEGQNVTFTCTGIGEKIQWHHRKHWISSNTSSHKIENYKDNDKEGRLQSKLHIIKVSLKDSGRYRCILKKEGNSSEKNITLHVQGPPKISNVSNSTSLTGLEALLMCTGKSVPSSVVKWLKNEKDITESEKYSIEERTENSLHSSILTIRDLNPSDNGTYVCSFENMHGSAYATPVLFVHDPPKILVTKADSLGPHKMEVEWTIEAGSVPPNSTEIVLVPEDGHEISIPIESPTETSVILDKSDLGEESDEEIPANFLVFVRVTSAIAPTESNIVNVTMLTFDLEFVPEVYLKGSTKDSLSVSWTQPDGELRSYVDSYQLSLTNVDTGQNVETVKEPKYTDHLFEDLEQGTRYEFTIRACLKRMKECSPSSKTVAGKTLSEPPNAVSDVIVHCMSNRTSGQNEVLVRWEPPEDDSKVNRYKIELKSSAYFINELGQSDYYQNLTEKIVPSESRNYTFYDLEPNTNYTVKVYAGSKTGSFSSSLLMNCETPFWLPSAPRSKWYKYKAGERMVLKLPTPKVSQRNGTICCHRIVVVRLQKNQTISDLPPPPKVSILSYDSVHNSPVMGGYVAEAFVKQEKINKYLVIGDGLLNQMGNWSSECARCIRKDPTASPDEEPMNEEGIAPSGGEAAPSSLVRSRYMHRRSPETVPIAEDGHLSQDFNYTGFLVMSVRDKNGTLLSSYSDFFNVIQPMDDPSPHLSSTPSAVNHSLTHIVYILGALIILLLLMAMSLGFLLCHYHKKRKQLIEDGADESLSGSLGRIFRNLRRSHTLMSQPGIDVAPIPKDQLVTEYLEKIKDSELGFRREFEALPEKFYDRSSRASEMPENASKNRYPDIKAYDQTRVKLSQVNGIVGSNYINANYVLGYKERKKFICAQGPMESTVNDFWRMIVEQRSSLCIMLTNLEETGKVKCVKYWPEAGEPKTFGNITVRLVKEKLYADYLVRTLRAEWTVNAPNPATTASNNALSVENGIITSGTATTKSNSSTCNSVNNSNYNSLSSNSMSNSEETKCHEVQQYHYLVWKDFVAPEHPVGLLSFLRRINEAYSPDMGPLLVHCSAGVGRTGTLVALDTLVAELDEEMKASIFNVICDLRHQRNFLVQSLKQYIFVHRALMEHAQFGNTELTLPKLKENWNKHQQQNSEEAADETSDLKKQFERLSRVIEDRKAFTVANNEMNRSKNRYDFVIPYDTNCVILTPLPTLIGATYINSSFITGFDLGENFIVTQDPLENTVSDFWRMIYEQEVNTIVMLSELGSGEEHCSKYWPDEEETHEYINVKFVASESYPKYSTRSFSVTNTKNGDSISVTQFQYVGWSGNMGEVPLVTFGIMEVITRVQAHNDANLANISNLSLQPPTVVHCSGGGDRSSVYVCLNNCLRQLRRESCVDVFQTARKIRSQRQFQLQDFAQYEFVYKALVEYVDMKRGENL